MDGQSCRPTSWWTRTGALAAAAAVDAKPRDERGPWEGVPIGLKDILCVKGMETTCGSRILKGYIPPYDATVIAKLRAAGLIFLGKLNMDEFAMGSSTENSAYQTTRNPWDLDRVPGGSSGGSAACVAAAEAPWALGTDTGGSIRQPASLCGVVGLKPTYGAVSRYGLVAFASSLDQIGPLTRDVKDAAALLDLIAGRDPLRLHQPGSAASRSACPRARDLEGLRFGVIREFVGDACEPGVREVFDAAVDAIGALGGVCEEVSLPSVERGIAAYYLIAPSEASSNLARFDGVRYGHRTAHARRPLRDVHAHPQRGLRRRGQAAHHDRHLRPLRRLLRRLLRSGAADAHAHHPGLRAGLRPLRLPDLAHLAHGGLQDRGADRRPAGHVPVRPVHHPGQPGRPARHQPPGRLLGRAAGGPADHRAALLASGAAGRGPRRGAEAAGADRGRAARGGGADERGQRRGRRRAGHRADGWEAVIGLEIHVQLSTRTKMFCGCEVTFGEPPNTHVCPVCLGHPGVLPVTNEKAVEYATRIALALNCRIAERTIFHRKNYFYPDLPKAYQISQYDLPLGIGGHLDVELEDGSNLRVGITRVHMEEDAGKLVHAGGASGRIDGADYSLVDFNRGGTPLVEIVSEPDICHARPGAGLPHPAAQPGRAAGRLRRQHGGGLAALRRQRLGAPARASRLGTKTELKNMNSFRFLQRGLEAEIERQIDALEVGRAHRAGDRALRSRHRHGVDACAARKRRTTTATSPSPTWRPSSWTRPTWSGCARRCPSCRRPARSGSSSSTGCRPRTPALLAANKPLGDYFETLAGRHRRRRGSRPTGCWAISPAYLNAAGLEVADCAGAAREALAELLGLVEDGTLSGKMAKEVFEAMTETGQGRQDASWPRRAWARSPTRASWRPSWPASWRPTPVRPRSSGRGATGCWASSSARS